MPAADERIRAALRASALEPPVDDVAARVTAKRAHRRTVRRVEALVAGVAAVAIVAGGAFVLVDDSTDRRVAVAPAPGALPVVRVASGAPRPDAGPRVTVRSVRVTPDEGYVRGPLLEGKGGLALAAYDRSGSSYTFPPSHIVRIDADGNVVDRIDLQGEILSLADGEGARWALTRDKTVLGPEDPEFRVKRIGPDGSVLSNAVPPGEQLAGPIVAGGGGVWVPTRTAVLRFDVVTGQLAASIPMETTSDRRSVVNSGKAVYVSDGRELKRLDPAQALPAGSAGELTPALVTEIVDVVSPENQITFVYLAQDSSGSGWLVWSAGKVLPLHGFEATGIRTANGVVWVEGALDGRRTLLVMDTGENGLRIAHTIRLKRTDDTNLIFHSPNELFLASNGSLFRVRVPD